MEKKVFYVDIDNTICKTKGMDYENCIPLMARIKKINDLYDEGHEIHYYTARGSRTGIDHSEFTNEQLKKWGCKFHYAHSTKPFFDYIIDDRAINSEVFFK